MFFLKKKHLKYTCKQRDATDGYCEVLNMNLNIWFDIPIRYIENVCVIVSVVVYFQKDLLTDLVRIFPFYFLWYFSSYG